MGIKPEGFITMSFSELQTYIQCPTKHKLTYFQPDLPKEESPALAYGTSIHVGVQSLWTNTVEESIKFFEEKLVETFENIDKSAFDNYKNIGGAIIENFAKTHYLNHGLIQTEYQLREDIIPNKFFFTGFIDAFLEQDTETGKKKVIDFKSTARGWSKKDKNDPMKKLQLLLYKRFLTKKLEIDPSEIDCEFVLLRGTDQQIETVPVSSTVEEIEHAYDILINAIKMIYKQKITDIKNPSNCFFCRWNDPRYCDRVSTIRESNDYLLLQEKLIILK